MDVHVADGWMVRFRSFVQRSLCVFGLLLMVYDLSLWNPHRIGSWDLQAHSIYLGTKTSWERKKLRSVKSTGFLINIPITEIDS